MNLTRYTVLGRRVAGAVRRHGALTVATAVVGVVARHGLTATLKVGREEQPFPWSAKSGKTAVRAAGPADLDEAYALPAAEWEPWRPIVGSRRAAPGRGEPRPLTFVVPAEPADAFARTAAAVRAVPGARLQSSGEAAGDTADGFHVFLQAGDLPSPDIAWEITEAARGGVADVVTFDLYRRRGDAVQPLLLPGANPTLIQACDYTFSRVALADRLLDGAEPSAVHPRQRILQWMAGRPAIETRGRWRHIGRPMVEAQVEDETIAQERRRARASGPPPDGGGEPVTAVICTKDKGHLTRQLVRQLLAEDPALLGEVVIVSNNTANPYAIEALQELAGLPRVRVARIDEPFNFSRLSNAGARLSAGRGPLLFLNDDIVPVTGDWLQRLRARLADPATGTVGPLLLYPDERVQHAGMYLGCRGAAGHTLKGARLPDEDYLFMACAPREVSAVTGAVLMTPRGVFEAVGGFDEQLGTYLQDVDYCLRLRNLGLVNVFDPGAVLIHMESTSINELGVKERLQQRRTGEWLRFRERWGEALVNDPFHPRGFDREDESLRRLAGPDGARP